MVFKSIEMVFKINEWKVDPSPPVEAQRHSWCWQKDTIFNQTRTFVLGFVKGKDRSERIAVVSNALQWEIQFPTAASKCIIYLMEEIESITRSRSVWSCVQTRNGRLRAGCMIPYSGCHWPWGRVDTTRFGGNFNFWRFLVRSYIFWVSSIKKDTFSLQRCK